jgi:hypothetical protein
MNTKQTKAEKEQEKTQAIEWLKKNIKAGTRIYSVLNGVSSSGMTRHISFYMTMPQVTVKKNQPWEIMCLNWYIAKACDYKMDKNGAIIATGCGMDMGYHVVTSLSYALTNGKKYDTLPHSWL